VLGQLELDIARALQSIKRGIAMLEERRPVGAEQVTEDDEYYAPEPASHAQL
jgi:hypothetical protein